MYEVDRQIKDGLTCNSVYNNVNTVGEFYAVHTCTLLLSILTYVNTVP